MQSMMSHLRICSQVESIQSRVLEVWQERRWWTYLVAQYLQKVPVDAAKYGAAEFWRADWHCGVGRDASWVPVPPSSQQPAESINSKLKRDVRGGRKRLGRHTEVLDALARACKAWTQPVHPDDVQRGKCVSLMGMEGSVSTDRPLSPCPWMLAEGKKLRPPLSSRIWNYPSIPRLLHLMEASKGTARCCYEDFSRGDHRYLCLRQAKAGPVPPGTGLKLLRQLKAVNVDSLTEAWLEENIFTREEGMEAYRFNKETFNSLWMEYCLTWRANPPCDGSCDTAITRCTCWMFAWRGSCTHAYALEEYLGVRIWSGGVIPSCPSKATKSRKKKRGSSEEATGRKRRG